MEETIKITKKIEGWLTEREAKLLFNLARNLKGTGIIVEIGSWKGKSTICLAKGSKEGKRVKVYAIDPHTGSPEHSKRYGKVWTFDEFLQNIKNAGVEDLVVPIAKTSEDAYKSFNLPVDLLFIDGNHEYKSVKLDFELWNNKLIEGGIVAFHDSIGWPGPRKVVDEKILRSKNFKTALIVDSITFTQKVSKNSIKDRLLNYYILLLRHFYLLVQTFHLPKNIRKILKRFFNAVSRF